MRTLLVDGHVYSPAEPFATSVLIEDGLIAWIGAEGGAALQAADEVVELAGDLLVPGFVDLTGSGQTPGFLHSIAADVPVAYRWPDARWAEAGPAPVAVVPADPCRLRSRIASGLPTALAPQPGVTAPWEVLRCAVHRVAPEERLTARAAVAALTRGAWRLLDRPEDGVLRVGAAASFVRWAVEDLVVETPDARISNWSTDPRAATPGLPPLDPGAELPRFVAAWRDGVRV